MSDYYAGEIRMFSGSYAPEDWHLCDGALLPLKNYEVLYSLIGTTYGGDGVTTFGLPDLRGRIPIGQGQGANLTNRVLAQQGGSEAVALTTDTIPAHTHVFNTLKADATTGTLVAGRTGALAYAQGVNGARTYMNNNAASPAVATLAPSSVGNSTTGANQSHNNMMPSAVVNFIIALVGTYPQRSA